MNENSQITDCPLAPPKGQPEVVAVTGQFVERYRLFPNYFVNYLINSFLD